MPAPRRRLSVRRRLERPLEAVLGLCREDHIKGWIIDEQDDGIGMAFGAEDAALVRGHQKCCVRQPAELWLEDDDPDGPRPIPMVLAHVTQTRRGIANVGLAFDVARMQPEDIVHLLGIWRRLVFGRSR